MNLKPKLLIEWFLLSGENGGPLEECEWVPQHVEIFHWLAQWCRDGHEEFQVSKQAGW